MLVGGANDVKNGDATLAPSLLILAAGLSSRYGTAKSLVPLGPSGETLIDYAIFDAGRAGFGETVIVTRPELRNQLERHLKTRTPGSLIRFVYQSPDDLPPHTTWHGSRERPWGTGHAILAARKVIDGPFVAINCDDFYGAAAYRLAAEHIESRPTTHALVGYRLTDTLSPNGGVSRAVCGASSEGSLLGLTEVLDVRRRTDGITGVTPAGETVRLSGTEIVSLNFWVFHPSIFGHLEKQFRDFVSNKPGRDQEFFVSEAVNRLLLGDTIAVRLVQTGGPWFGITHPDDLKAARETITALISDSQYPDCCFGQP
jgi:NDP-sugar pyrophosphorylase family protein